MNARDDELRSGRAAYMILGAVIFAVQFLLELVIGGGNRTRAFGSPTGLTVLLAFSVPLFGVLWWVSRARLRDAGAPLFLSIFFAIPVVRIVAFVLLASIPSQEELALAPAARTDDEPSRARLPILEGWLPAHPVHRQLVATAGTFLLPTSAFVVAAMPARVPWAPFAPSREALGWGLFVGVPFAAGIWSGFVASYGRKADIVAAVWSALVSGTSFFAALFVFALEGVACILMAAPIVFPLMVLGAALGHALGQRRRPRIASALFALALSLLVHDLVAPPEPVHLCKKVSVVVNAPAELVFANVARIAPYDEVPGPVAAILATHLESTLEGTGVGAHRRCVYTTGDVEERVTTWRPGRELAFVVVRAPAGMRRCGDPECGRFVLTPNADGTTTLEAQAFYSIRLEPTAYWSAWTQRLVAATLERGLEHVKSLCEGKSRPTAKPAPLPERIAMANATCACTRHAPGR